MERMLHLKTCSHNAAAPRVPGRHVSEAELCEACRSKFSALAHTAAAVASGLERNSKCWQADKLPRLPAAGNDE